MTNSRLANHLIFWTLILGVFVIPASMVASDLAAHRCNYTCNAK